jgi:hypothetical protein
MPDRQRGDGEGAWVGAVLAVVGSGLIFMD